MTSFEQQAGEFLLAGQHPVLAALREQWVAARMSSSEIRNECFYTVRIELPEECVPLFSRGSAAIDDVRVVLEGVEDPVELTLWITLGKIETLNGVSADFWPETLQILRFYYVGSPDGTIEVAQRDLEWAVRNVVKRQEEPDRSFLDSLPDQADFWELVDKWVPEQGPATTIQGEVIRTAMRLCAEFHRNVCGNWPGSTFYSDMVVFLREQLSDGALEPVIEQFAIELLDLLQSYGECDFDLRSDEDYQVLFRDLEVLHQIATAWCLLHPELTPFQGGSPSCELEGT